WSIPWRACARPAWASSSTPTCSATFSSPSRAIRLSAPPRPCCATWSTWAVSAAQRPSGQYGSDRLQLKCPAPSTMACLSERAPVALLTVLVVLTPRATQGHLRPVHSSRPPTPLECYLRAQLPCLTPAEVRAAYGIDDLLHRGITGAGRTIAIVVSFGSPSLR